MGLVEVVESILARDELDAELLLDQQGIEVNRMDILGRTALLVTEI